MVWVAVIISAVLSGAIAYAGLIVLKKRAVGSSSAEKENLVSLIERNTADLYAQLDSANNYISSGQINYVNKLVSDTKTELSRGQELLNQIEARMETAQKSVEEREAQQEQTKTRKKEEEQQLYELLNRYTDIYSESVTLEQKLAGSLKNLDSIVNEMTLTDPQKSVLKELSELLESSGGRLRDLMTEYDTTKQRLEMLREQYESLEEEYTKLVEQQLGD